jgi:hypothetical protein
VARQFVSFESETNNSYVLATLKVTERKKDRKIENGESIYFPAE